MSRMQEETQRREAASCELRATSLVVYNLYCLIGPKK
jgi:hypothetical protein